jgi:putative endonuclease
MWYVYILECSNNALYTGITNNIKRRLREHNSGKGGRYTRARQPVRLIYTETYNKKSEALRREIQLKGWTRKKKEALIEGDFRLIKQLLYNLS